MRLLLLVIGLLVTGALVAGCGGDDNEGDNTGAGTPPAETTSAPPETSAPEDAGGSGGTGGGANPSDPQVEQAVEACKQQIGAQPGISEDVKADLEEICEKAASGDEQAVQDATKEVCTKLIEENVPEGPAREQALAACDQAGQTP